MTKLYLAPMEELTGYVFRNVLEQHFGGVDKYFTPFLSPDNRIMKTRSRREIIPSNNEGKYVVPQLLTNNPEQFNEAAELMAGLGYEELNINFGCPSNTVAAKFKGSGILRAPDIMERFLEGVFSPDDGVPAKHPDMRISVKTRVGYNDTSDFEKVLGILARYPFCEVIVHPRLKKDLYNGSPRMEMFDMACERLSVPVVYNGDVFTAEDFEELDKSRASAVMIGRGAVRDPGIFRRIKTGHETTKDELYDFLSDLYETYKAETGAANALAKLKEVWSYTVLLIGDEKERSRVFKSIIKAKGESEYRDAIAVARGKIKM